jgi:carboxypeptidase C (cathepsin A)
MKVKPNPRTKADVIKNVYGWNAKADLLFVDQPVGTGFSYTSDQGEYVKTEEEPPLHNPSSGDASKTAK